MKRRDLISHVVRHGCVFVREGAKHTWFYNPATRSYSAIPRHREIVEFMAKKVCRELGIPPP